MTTYVIRDEEIEEVKARLERLKEMADNGDEVAQAALDAIGYAQFLQVRLQDLEKAHAGLAQLVITQSEFIERIVDILKAMDMRVPLPETPDDLPGYG